MGGAYRRWAGRITSLTLLWFSCVRPNVGAELLGTSASLFPVSSSALLGAPPRLPLGWQTPAWPASREPPQAFGLEMPLALNAFGFNAFGFNAFGFNAFGFNVFGFNAFGF
jgi:hypothetical protein